MPSLSNAVFIVQQFSFPLPHQSLRLFRLPAPCIIRSCHSTAVKSMKLSANLTLTGRIFKTWCSRDSIRLRCTSTAAEGRKPFLSVLRKTPAAFTRQKEKSAGTISLCVLWNSLSRKSREQKSKALRKLDLSASSNSNCGAGAGRCAYSFVYGIMRRTSSWAVLT